MATEVDNRKHAANPVLRELQKRLRLDMNKLADNMSEGSCVDYPHYKECVGQITAYAYAERHLLDVDIMIDVDEVPDP